MTRADLAARLRDAIARSGKKKAQIARETPIDPGHLRKLLQGRVAIGRGKAEAMAPVLGVSASHLLGVDEAADAAPQVRSDRATNAERLGFWMLDLPEDVRAFTYFIGEVLRQPGGLKRFAEVAADSLASTATSIPGSAGRGRTPQAAATRVARQRKGSGR